MWVFSLFLVTTLLYYNSHTLKFTLIKCTSQWLNNTFRTVLPSPQSNSRGFSSSPKESPYPSSCFSFHLSPCLWKPLIHFLSLRNCLFWTFHIKRIIRYMTFCAWILLFGIIVSRFSHTVSIHVSVLCYILGLDDTTFWCINLALGYTNDKCVC